ncbi:10988_t:CDS:2, partial [Racocetra persica]
MSYLVFYLKKEVENTKNEYLRAPENEKQEWLKKRTMIQQTSLQLTHQSSFAIPNDFNFE